MLKGKDRRERGDAGERSGEKGLAKGFWLEKEGIDKCETAVKEMGQRRREVEGVLFIHCSNSRPDGVLGQL